MLLLSAAVAAALNSASAGGGGVAVVDASVFAGTIAAAVTGAGCWCCC